MQAGRDLVLHQRDVAFAVAQRQLVDGRSARLDAQGVGSDAACLDPPHHGVVARRPLRMATTRFVPLVPRIEKKGER